MPSRRHEAFPCILFLLAMVPIGACGNGNINVDGGPDATTTQDGSQDAAATRDGTTGADAGSGADASVQQDAGPDDCVKGSSAFVDGEKEFCNGIDDDGDGVIDDQQTGWVGFCDPKQLVDPASYTFQRSLAYYKTEFDKQWADEKDGRMARAQSCNPCDQEPYNLQVTLKALVTMHRATGEATYLDDAVAVANAMVDAADPYDVSTVSPSDPECFDPWVDTVSGGLRYWSTLDCTPTDAGWRYMLNELQGLRGISELSAVLRAKGDPRAERLFDHADQVISFYAMQAATKNQQGNCEGHPYIDAAADKRTHYAINAIDLYRASGETRFLDWANEIVDTQLSTVIEEDGDFLLLYQVPGSPKVNDTSHAGREAEFIRTLFELDLPGSAERVRKLVNTFLLRVWENDPAATLGGDDVYPFLFRNFTDGSNDCFSSTSPPYRTGSVNMGWHELSRYDARVLYLMETLTIGLIEKEVPTRLPAAPGCSDNGNTNYSHTLASIAEMAYNHRLMTERCGS